MSKQSFTPGPWRFEEDRDDPNDMGKFVGPNGEVVCSFGDDTTYCPSAGYAPDAGDASLIAAAPTQHEEMVRFLPIIERAEADPELWTRLTRGTGIATANAYRAAISKALGDQP